MLSHFIKCVSLFFFLFFCRHFLWCMVWIRLILERESLSHSLSFNSPNNNLKIFKCLINEAHTKLIVFKKNPQKEPGKVGERCGSAMQLKVCPNFRGFLSLQDETLMVESACHVLDQTADHKCKSSRDCGIDASSCKRRTCSFSGYCGLWETAP